MESKYSFKKADNYLYMKVSGKHKSGDFGSYLKVIYNECEKEKTNKILIDGLEVEKIVLSMMERFDLGEQLAKVMSHKIKVAIVWPEKNTNRFIETVAFNRGGSMQIFGTIDQATEWLSASESRS